MRVGSGKNPSAATFTSVETRGAANRSAPEQFCKLAPLRVDHAAIGDRLLPDAAIFNFDAAAIFIIS